MPTVSPTRRDPDLRVALLTDTLGDVNGVSRFLNDVADCARAAGRNLRIFTSTRFAVRELPNLVNLPPRFRMKLPGYPDLDLCLAPSKRLEHEIRAFGPDVIHVSTPGPIGWTGRRLARRLGLPLAGTYHTDFPAYIEHLFQEDSLTATARWAMRRFYAPFSMILTRSEAYRAALGQLGLDAKRCVRLRPGFHGERFDPSFREPLAWERFGIPATGAKVLYVGRVSVEKNLPFLARVWRQCKNSSAQLLVVGDGPYRTEMEETLRGTNAHFLGFQAGAHLSRVYANADLFVFPSTTDTLGQVVLESQASGLATLVTDRGGPQEMILPGRTGLVLPAGDPTAWAEAIDGLLEAPERSREMGRAAAAHAKGFTIERSFEHFWALHERLAAGEDFTTLPESVDPFETGRQNAGVDSLLP